ncbi:PucR family transcriptional regulator [Nocardia flavorosea]|uniref:PucR family transcriptional regulator n=1 Tax=Nocardia flavorosea TaxID=53429 RepID=A0A846YJX9_9NOCA|nr:PucR family transcriptional regulator [Nocardia flavorosea]NKY57960.1 PucR family transcriptional regulator [Nocardia flavorosea]
MTTPAPVTPAPEASALAARLSDAVEVLTDILVGRIAAADPSYGESGLLTEDQLAHTCRENLGSVIGALAGTHPFRLQPARAAGRLKAEQGIPIAALLHAYRLGGRLIWEELTARSDGPGDPRLHDLATHLWELIDLYSDAAVEAYRDTEVLLAHSDAQVQSRLIRTLFDDHSGNPARVLDVLRTLGFPERGAFAVVAIDTESTAPLPAKLAAALDGLGIRSVWDAQIDAYIGLMSAAAPAAIDRAAVTISSIVADRVGISTVFWASQAIPAGLTEARLAARSVRAGATGVVRFGDEPVGHLLIAVPAAGRRAATQILGPVLELPDPERDDLIAALDAWYRCGGSAAAVAETMHCHRNTVRYRLRKIRDLTGRDTTDPRQSAELYLALEAWSLLGAGREA